MPRKSIVPRTTVAHECAHCGDDFFPILQRLKEGKGKFCSNRCSKLSRSTRQTYTCEQCGSAFSLATWELKGKSGRFCQRQCAADFRRLTPEQRFWAKVNKTDTCWLWTGVPDAGGYGRMSIGDAKQTLIHAHRFSYELHFGPIGNSKIFVCHNCPTGDNPLCVRPSHLFLGTQADNMADMAKKLRSGRRKLTPEDVIRIRQRCANGEKYGQVAKDYSVHNSAVRAIHLRTSWKHVA